MTVELSSVGSMGVACDKLARMVALSSDFQTATKTVNYAQAAEYVHRKNVTGNKAFRRPLAIVSQLGHHMLQIISGGDKNYFIESGDLYLQLCIDTPEIYFNDNILAEIFADNFFTPVIKQVAALANADDPVVADRVVADEGHLDIRNITRMAFSETAQENWESIGRFWVAHYSVEWGGE